MISRSILLALITRLAHGPNEAARYPHRFRSALTILFVLLALGSRDAAQAAEVDSPAEIDLSHAFQVLWI
jgi:hypothetical protein